MEHKQIFVALSYLRKLNVPQFEVHVCWKLERSRGVDDTSHNTQALTYEIGYRETRLDVHLAIGALSFVEQFVKYILTCEIYTFSPGS